MFCRKCGKELLDDDLFCNHCGAPVATQQNSIENNEELQENQKAQEATVEQQQDVKEEKWEETFICTYTNKWEKPLDILSFLIAGMALVPPGVFSILLLIVGKSIATIWLVAACTVVSFLFLAVSKIPHIIQEIILAGDLKKLSPPLNTLISREEYPDGSIKYLIYYPTIKNALLFNRNKKGHNTIVCHYIISMLVRLVLCFIPIVFAHIISTDYYSGSALAQFFTDPVLIVFNVFFVPIAIAKFVCNRQKANQLSEILMEVLNNNEKSKM